MNVTFANFRAGRFVTASNRASILYVVKGVRGVWDPNVPGPDGKPRGAFRCPSGVSNGGELTDRFGRNCGEAVVRRVGRSLGTVSDVANGPDKPSKRPASRPVSAAGRANVAGNAEAAARRARRSLRPQRYVDASQVQGSERERLAAQRLAVTASREIEDVQNDAEALKRLLSEFRDRGSSYRRLAQNQPDSRYARERQIAADIYDDASGAVQKRIRDLSAGRRVTSPKAELDRPVRPELYQALSQRIEATVKRRESVIDKYLAARYGDSEPWADPEQNLSLSQMKKIIKNGDERALTDWAKKAYEHQSIELRDGKRLRTTVDGVSTNYNEYGKFGHVHGTVWAVHPDDKRWVPVGSFDRMVNPWGDTDVNAGERKRRIDTAGFDPLEPFVQNYELALGSDAKNVPDRYQAWADEYVKNSGFVSVFNPHAYKWAEGAGLKEARLSAGYTDGPYVWGRLGFRSTEPGELEELHRAMSNALGEFDAGRESVLDNEADAETVRMLLGFANDDKVPVAAKPGHFEFILAVSNNETEPDARKAREQAIKTFFQTEAPFGSGRYAFDQYASFTRTQRRAQRQARKTLAGVGS